MIIIGVIMDRKITYLNKRRAVSFHYTLVVQNPLFFEFVLWMTTVNNLYIFALALMAQNKAYMGKIKIRQEK